MTHQNFVTFFFAGACCALFGCSEAQPAALGASHAALTSKVSFSVDDQARGPLLYPGEVLDAATAGPDNYVVAWHLHADEGDGQVQLKPLSKSGVPASSAEFPLPISNAAFPERTQLDFDGKNYRVALDMDWGIERHARLAPDGHFLDTSASAIPSTARSMSFACATGGVCVCASLGSAPGTFEFQRIDANNQLIDGSSLPSVTLSGNPLVFQTQFVRVANQLAFVMETLVEPANGDQHLQIWMSTFDPMSAEASDPVRLVDSDVPVAVSGAIKQPGYQALTVAKRNDELLIGWASPPAASAPNGAPFVPTFQRFSLTGAALDKAHPIDGVTQLTELGALRAVGDGYLLSGLIDTKPSFRRLKADGTAVPAGLLDFGHVALTDKALSASAGSNVLLVTSTPYRTSDEDAQMYRALFDGAGKVVAKAAPFVFAAHAASTPAIVWGGSEWLSVWSDNRNGFDTWGLYGARVSTSGELLDKLSLPLVLGPKQQVDAALASNGNGYLLVNQARTPINYDLPAPPATVQISRLSAEAKPLGPPISLDDQQFYWSQPRVAWNGHSYLVAWVRQTSTGLDLYAARFDADGQALDGKGVKLTTITTQSSVGGNPYELWSPSVVATAGGFFVAWQQGLSIHTRDAYGAWLTDEAAGLKIATGPVSLTGNHPENEAASFDWGGVAIGCSPAVCAAAWEAQSTTLYRFDTSGNALPSVKLSTFNEPKLIWDGAAFLFGSYWSYKYLTEDGQPYEDLFNPLEASPNVSLATNGAGQTAAFNDYLHGAVIIEDNPKPTGSAGSGGTGGGSESAGSGGIGGSGGETNSGGNGGNAMAGSSSAGTAGTDATGGGGVGGNDSGGSGGSGVTQAGSAGSLGGSPTGGGNAGVAGTGGVAVAGAAGSPPVAPAAAHDSSGCGCSTAGGVPSRAEWPGLLLIALIAWRRRRSISRQGRHGALLLSTALVVGCGSGSSNAGTPQPQQIPAVSCQTANGGCAPEASCRLDEKQQVMCACKDGYVGDGKSCSPVAQPENPCVTANGGCDINATCSQGATGSVNCVCKADYTGDGQSCVLVDACAKDHGGCDPHATCSNDGKGGAQCACEAGFSGDGKRCTRDDPCAKNNGNCDPLATCNGSGTEVVCTCPSGYVGDGTQCTRPDTLNDPKNCGAFGHDCRGQSCSYGKCEGQVVFDRNGTNGFVDGQTLYFFGDDWMGVPKDGSATGFDLTLLGNTIYTNVVATSADYLYLASAYGASVARVAKSARDSVPEVVYTQSAALDFNGLAFDNGKMYAVDSCNAFYQGDLGAAITLATPSGTACPGGDSLSGLVVDAAGTYAYSQNTALHELVQVRLSDRTMVHIPLPVEDDQNNPGDHDRILGLKRLGQALYWYTLGNWSEDTYHHVFDYPQRITVYQLPLDTLTPTKMRSVAVSAYLSFGGIAPDASAMYFVGNDVIWKVPFDAAADPFAIMTARTFVAVDDEWLYASTDYSIERVAK